VLLYQMKVCWTRTVVQVHGPLFLGPDSAFAEATRPSLDYDIHDHRDHTRGRIVSILQLLEDRLEDIIGHATAHTTA
jgi:hypothetical protein